VKQPRIAVLGAGMLGVCTALELARRGIRVTLLEGTADLLQGASCWNEGKIHLGFLYAADPSMRTAKRLIDGGLAFGGLVGRLLGRGLEAFATPEDDIYLLHRASVVDSAGFRAYANRTAELVREAASQAGAAPYLADVTRATVLPLSQSELREVAFSDDIVAGFRIPERSVSTLAIADLLRRAVYSEPQVDVRCNTRIDGLRRRDDGRLEVMTGGAPAPANFDGPFDVVVNALWEGRPAVDASLGIHPPAPWTHRFRAALFARNAKAGFRSAVVCTGPFGDVKCYADGRLYLSWYEAGLLAEGCDIEPPRRFASLTAHRRSEVLRETVEALSRFFPAVRQSVERAEEIEVQGGWVYAVGQGSLTDPASTLHQRDKFDITVNNGYISVDTAKYSLAPWLAARVAQIIAQH
jgi:glycine/D-amino acid oxidase-like deaminating enzyme